MKLVSDANFQQEIRENAGTALVLLTGDWCQPCQLMKPIVSELEEQLQDIDFYVGDVDAMSNVVQDLNVSSLPSYAIFIGGMVQEVSSGSMTKAELRQWIHDSV